MVHGTLMVQYQYFIIILKIKFTQKLFLRLGNSYFLKIFLNLVNKILNADTHDSKIFNVGSNETITIEKIFFKIQKIMNCNDNLFSVKQPSSIDLKAIPLDDSLIRKELKWKPEYNIDLGLKLIIQWYEKNRMRKSYSHLK